MDKQGDMAVFAAAVDRGGFSAAARALRLTPSAVSKKIARLEDRLGARLLNRTTRQISLTEEGDRYYERARRILSDIEEAELEVASLQAAPRGRLRVNSVIHFGLHHLMPLIPEFLARYPQVEVELTLEDRIIEIVDEGVDVAIRAGFLEDSSLVARRLGGNWRVVVAAPAYLAAQGAPAIPADLAHHNCLRYSLAPALNHWEFAMTDGGTQMIEVQGNFAANTGEALREAAIAGVGIARLTTYSVGEAIQAGALVNILTDHTQDGGSVYAIYPHRRHLSSKVRVFVDYLAEQIGPSAPWDV